MHITSLTDILSRVPPSPVVVAAAGPSRPAAARRGAARWWLPAALGLLALLSGLATVRPATANGVPLRVPLAYLGGLSNWGPQEARGEAEISFSEALLRVDVRGLPPLQNEQYQLWLVKSGSNRTVPVGALTVGAGSVGGYTGKLTVEGYDYDLLIVTVEPRNDSDPAPSGKRSIGGFFAPISRPESSGPTVVSDVQPAELPRTGEAEPAPAGSPPAGNGLPFRSYGGAALIGGGLILMYMTLRRVTARRAP